MWLCYKLARELPKKPADTDCAVVAHLDMNCASRHARTRLSCDRFTRASFQTRRTNCTRLNASTFQMAFIPCIASLSPFAFKREQCARMAHKPPLSDPIGLLGQMDWLNELMKTVQVSKNAIRKCDNL